MRWNKFIDSRFQNDDKYKVIENDEVILVNSTNSTPKYSKLNLIFILDKNNLKEIYANYSKSRIILSFTDFADSKFFFSRFKDEKSLKQVELFLDSVITKGWKERLYLYKGDCYKVRLFFGEVRRPLTYKIAFFDNFLFHFRLLINYVFKELDNTNLDMNSFVEEEFIITPLEGNK